ncbi:ABC1 kinase family protein [Lignipirellula cremea]|uniref:ABC1 atypical kinase-like domain-containing protein n=1 Tax=Lignipirellula cremea TaxID=2528010 RepID=A0A518DUB6_9BACT|nr:AarF/ABC1/UbiB kinase family protein [Lignipirellula cremea]QDU95430.1 putative protein kinase UbiB [Lignipirellula cremea]
MSLKTIQRTAGYAGLAASALSVRRATSARARSSAQDHLCQRLGRLHGLPQKVGQMLSFTSNPEKLDAAEAFAPLQESAEPLPWPTIARILAAAWGRPVLEVLAEVDTKGHAASLGQVHQARLLDGTEVAIKVQYPGIRQAVQTDLKALGWLSLPLGNLRRGFDLEAYRLVIGSCLATELDYQQEAAQQDAMGRDWEADEAVIVPRVVQELSDETVLVTQWESGDHWTEVPAAWSPGERRRLANTLLRFFLQGLFHHGRMQADWHPGNFRFRRNGGNPQVVVYDFGCLVRPEPRQRLLLARLIRATVQQDESPWPLMRELGFQENWLQPLAGKLPAVCRLLLEPFCTRRPYDLHDWKLAERMEAVLADDRWNFRFAGPPGLVFVLRAFHGVIHYLQGTGEPIDWHAAVQETLAPLQSQIENLAVTAGEPVVACTSVATWLRVRVVREGRTQVQLSQPAMGIERLEELLDDELKQRILLAGIDLQKSVEAVRSRGYAPGPVFELVDEEKEVRVWLE